MKRPIFIITLGVIIGSIWGLYFNIVSCIFFVLLLSIIITFSIVKNETNRRIVYAKKIVNIIIKKSIILTFSISMILSFLYTIYSIKKYEDIYNNFAEGEVIAIIMSDKKESEYTNTYKIKIENLKSNNIIQCKRKKFLLKIPKDKDNGLKYGDKIKFYGEYNKPTESRNYGGFDYKIYLRTQKIYGIIKTNKITVLKSNCLSVIERISYNIKEKIISNVRNILPEKTRELFLGILIGYDDELQEDVKISFRKSNLSHLLAVSGAHIAYIIIGIEILFKKIKVPKRLRTIFIIIFLFLFVYITDFSSSVVRASIMGLLVLILSAIYMKQDIQTIMSIPIVIMLLYNPYKILDIGLILSYFATIGIVFFSKIKRKRQEKDNSIICKIKSYIKELVLITIYANVFIIPIMMYNFNTLSLTFTFSNLIASIIIGLITIGGLLLILISFMNLKFAHIISIPYNYLLEILLNTSNITSKLYISNLIISTPNLIVIIIYYIALFQVFILIYYFKKYNNRYLCKKISSTIKCLLNYIKKIIFKLIITFIFTILIITVIKEIIPKNLEINFIDVGQGDSCVITTPFKKRILIDSGGSDSQSFDVGESTLLPYLLDRKITQIDFVVISHFDSDHCKGLSYLIENIKINNIVVSKQYESTENFENILKLVKEKNINLIIVKKGDILKIDKSTKIKILNPSDDLEADINENSIVMFVECFKRKIFFTGDISEKIEQQLIKSYNTYLKADILKVAHHGSKTSSSENFINLVNPPICLIGVGKDNKFGHPNKEVIERLNKKETKIYRTDLYGEISIKINRNRKNKNKYSY